MITTETKLDYCIILQSGSNVLTEQEISDQLLLICILKAAFALTFLQFALSLWKNNSHVNT